MAKKTSIGGQALIEGIMMRGPKVTAMAVRNEKTKEIILEEYPTKGADRAKFFKLPFIRGIFNILGLRWLLCFYPTSKYGGLSLELLVLSSYLPSSSDLIHTQGSECRLYADEPQMYLLTHKSNCYQTPHMND